LNTVAEYHDTNVQHISGFVSDSVDFCFKSCFRYIIIMRKKCWNY